MKRAEIEVSYARIKQRLYKLGFRGLGICLIVFGIVIMGAQVLEYLRTGSWESVSLMDVISSTKTARWLHDPKSWVGLAQILRWVFEFVPLSLFVIGIGWRAISAAEEAR